MSKRPLLLAALCLASAALAQEDGPPAPPPVATPAPTPAPAPEALFEPKFGVVFNLQNIFQNASLLSGFRGGLGVQFAINPDLALRTSVALTHSSNPATVVTTTTTINDMTTETRTLTRPSPTSTFGVLVGGDLLQRLSKGALAPYVGGGLWLAFDSEATKWRDDVSVADRVTERDDSTLGFGVGARGLLGVSWRVHPHFMLFAEYALNITIVDHTSTVERQSVTSAGNPATSNRSSSASTRFFDFSTALSQGAALGLVAFF